MVAASLSKSLRHFSPSSGGGGGEFSVPPSGEFCISDDRHLEPYDWIPFTFPFNMTGHPGASVPCGVTGDKLPVWLQIVGRRFEDAAVLRAAAAFEQLQPWAHAKPSLE